LGYCYARGRCLAARTGRADEEDETGRVVAFK
jgi:hypothetical protein